MLWLLGRVDPRVEMAELELVRHFAHWMDQVLRTDDESGNCSDIYPSSSSPDQNSGRINSSSSSSFLANECLSYAFSVWRMEGAWGGHDIS